MEALDGNAIGGVLFEHYGAEMTAEIGTCRHCGATSQMAELRVYVRAPGTVGRCPACGKVVLVLVAVAGVLRVDDSGFTMAEPVG